MDYESERTRSLGCWDGPNNLIGSIDAWTTNYLTPDFEPADEFCDFLIDVGFGKDCGDEVRSFWTKLIKRNYYGDEGRKRARMAAINLRERDGLLGRLRDVACPVLWLHVSYTPLLVPKLSRILIFPPFRAQATRSTASPTRRKRFSSLPMPPKRI